MHSWFLPTSLYILVFHGSVTFLDTTLVSSVGAEYLSEDEPLELWPQCLSVQPYDHLLCGFPLDFPLSNFIRVSFCVFPWRMSGKHDYCLHWNFSNFGVNEKHPESLLNHKFLALPRRFWWVGLGGAQELVSLTSSQGSCCCWSADLTLNSTALPAFWIVTRIFSHSVLWAVHFLFSQVLPSRNLFLLEEALTPWVL